MYRFLRFPGDDLEPPEEIAVVADCGHEVWPGERLWEFEGRQLCPDCMHEKVEGLSWEEIAEVFLGCTYEEVE